MKKIEIDNRSYSHPKIKNTLQPKGVALFFDEEEHKYTDVLGTIYTSMTTVIGKYGEDFKKNEIAKACERIGRNPSHPKYKNYKGKSASQLIKEWDRESNRANEHGTEKHAFLENNINDYNNFRKRSVVHTEKNRLYTLDDIIKNHNFGKLDIDGLSDSPLADRYPTILDFLKCVVKDGFSVYTELGLYDVDWGVSGLADLPLIHHEYREILIGDWKTNKAPMRFDSGYYNKFPDGRLNLDSWVAKNDYFAPPMIHLPFSHGNGYALQLSGYGTLAETFGYKHIGNVLCHIRPVEDAILPREMWEEEVNIMELPMLNRECINMFEHHKQMMKQENGLFYN